MNTSRKKTFIIITLCCMLAFMGTGFAILSSTLKVTGTNSMVGKWDVHIGSITPETNGLATSNSVAFDSDKTTANLSLNLYEHGDYVEYTIVIQNAGNIPAKLVDFWFDHDVSNEVNLIEKYIKITNTAVLDETLPANSSKTFKVKVELFNPNDEEIPEVQNAWYYFDFVYEQDTGV